MRYLWIHRTALTPHVASQIEGAGKTANAMSQTLVTTTRYSKS